MGAFRSSDIDRGNRQYIAATMREAMLERDVEMDLARRWRDSKDESALHALTRAYARFVVRVATRFRGYGHPLGDLIQEGNIGLMEAAARFDPERNARFSTYAAWWILASIQDFVLRQASVVRLATSPGMRRLFFNLRRARARNATGADGTLTTADRERMAVELDVSVADIERMEMHLSAADLSLDNAIARDGEGDPLVDRLADERARPDELVEEVSEASYRSRSLARAIDELTPRERRIIADRFLSEQRITLDQLGEGLGVSKERVRQIEAKALDKLRATLTGNGFNPSN